MAPMFSIQDHREPNKFLLHNHKDFIFSIQECDESNLLKNTIAPDYISDLCRNQHGMSRI